MSARRSHTTKPSITAFTSLTGKVNTCVGSPSCAAYSTKAPMPAS